MGLAWLEGKRPLTSMWAVTKVHSRVVAGETTSREMFKGCQLPAARGTLGIATVGDALHKLIPATTLAPCSVKEVTCSAKPRSACAP